MRALTRMRTLAAACALLLFVSGTAAAFDKQIDRSGGPPLQTPTEVGDPDTGNGLVYFRQLFLATQLSNPWLSRIASQLLAAGARARLASTHLTGQR